MNKSRLANEISKLLAYNVLAATANLTMGRVLEDKLEVGLKAGECAAETFNVLHNNRNRGSDPAKLMVFYAGATDSTLTIKEN